MSRIVGLSDLKKKEEANDSDEEKQQSLYAGGLNQRGGGSGQNVLGPPTSNANPSSLFERIQQQATRSVTEPTGGRRITMYRNGFTVDNGPLRDVNEPDNQAFLRDLARGVIPRGNIFSVSKALSSSNTNLFIR